MIRSLSVISALLYCWADPATAQPCDLPDMVTIDGGKAEFGTPLDVLYELGAEDSSVSTETVHDAFITGMEVAVREFTRAEWECLHGPRTWPDACGLTCPATGVSWYEAVKAANALSRLAGAEECYRFDGSFDRDDPASITVNWDTACSGFRLPTEHEWEYVAIASGADLSPQSGWSLETAPNGCLSFSPEGERGICQPQPAATREADGIGLFDLFGNVAEWTWSLPKWYASDEPRFTGSLSDFAAGRRVVRGGSYWSESVDLRRSARDWAPPELGLEDTGVRFVRSVAIGTGSSASDHEGR